MVYGIIYEHEKHLFTFENSNLIGSISLSNGYSVSYLPVHVFGLNCAGKERTIWECPHTSAGTCSTNNDAAVSCQEGS